MCAGVGGKKEKTSFWLELRQSKDLERKRALWFLCSRESFPAGEEVCGKRLSGPLPLPFSRDSERVGLVLNGVGTQQGA